MDFRKSGIGYKKISRQLIVPLSSVITLICLGNSQNSTVPLLRSGRPRMIAGRTVGLFVRKVKKTHKVTLKEFQQNLKEGGVNVSNDTICAVLHRNNIVFRSPRKSQILTRKHFRDRLNFTN